MLSLPIGWLTRRPISRSTAWPWSGRSAALRGAILLDLGSTTSAQHGAVSRLGYFATRINVVAYSNYDRTAFVDTLNDWGWFGPEEQRPGWYTG
jgi:hypothetical protein